MTNDQKILVEYPDKTSRETTVGELIEFFNAESKTWKRWFFNMLEITGTAYGRFASYTLIQ